MSLEVVLESSVPTSITAGKGLMVPQDVHIVQVLHEKATNNNLVLKGLLRDQWTRVIILTNEWIRYIYISQPMDISTTQETKMTIQTRHALRSLLKHNYKTNIKCLNCKLNKNKPNSLWIYMRYLSHKIQTAQHRFRTVIYWENEYTFEYLQSSLLWKWQAFMPWRDGPLLVGCLEAH